MFDAPITVQIDKFRPDENNRDFLSYMWFDHEDLLNAELYVGRDLIVITPAGIRYAVIADYEADTSTYYVQYTTYNLPELA